MSARRMALAQHCWSRHGQLCCSFEPGHVGVWHTCEGVWWTDSALDQGEDVIRDLADWEPPEAS